MINQNMMNNGKSKIVSFSQPDTFLMHSQNHADKRHAELPDYRFTLLDVFIVLVSMGTYIADIVTDILVMVVYWNINESSWAALTLTFLIVPAIVMQIFSTRWYLADGHKISFSLLLIHILMMGPLVRYGAVVRLGFRARQTKNIHDFQQMYSELSDVSMLRLFECFLESAPQLVLQLYIMIIVEEGDHILTGISACFSLLSLSWAIVAYTKALRAAVNKRQRVSWCGMALQTIWRVGMVLGRITAIVLFATAFKEWTLLLLGLHWLMMTIWVVMQDTDFCNTWWEERLFNIVIGIIYVFCFFNMKEGKSRWRAVFYYAVILIENSVMILLWWPYRVDGTWFNVPALFAVWGGFILGSMCMLLYYRFFHPNGQQRCHCCIEGRNMKYLCQAWWWNSQEQTRTPPQRYKYAYESDYFDSNESSEEELDPRDFTDLRCSYDTPTTFLTSSKNKKPVCTKHLYNPRHIHCRSDQVETNNEQKINQETLENLVVLGDAKSGFKVRALQPQNVLSDPNPYDGKPIAVPQPKATSTPGNKLKTNLTCIKEHNEEPLNIKEIVTTPTTHRPGSPNTLVKNWVKRTQQLYENGDLSFMEPDSGCEPDNLKASSIAIKKTHVRPKTRRNPLRMKSFNKRDRQVNCDDGKPRVRKITNMRNSFREAFGFHVIDLDNINEAEEAQNKQKRAVVSQPPVSDKNINAIKCRKDEPPWQVSQNISNIMMLNHDKNKDVDAQREKIVTTKNVCCDETNVSSHSSNMIQETSFGDNNVTPKLNNQKETPAVYPSRSTDKTCARKKLAFHVTSDDQVGRRKNLFDADTENSLYDESKCIRPQEQTTKLNKNRKVLGALENKVRLY